MEVAMYGADNMIELSLASDKMLFLGLAWPVCLKVWDKENFASQQAMHSTHGGDQVHFPALQENLY